MILVEGFGRLTGIMASIVLCGALLSAGAWTAFKESRTRGEPSSNAGVLDIREQDATLWDAAGDGSTISPNGKRIAFIDWDFGGVAIRDVASGSVVRLTEKGPFAKSAGFPEPSLVFSPGSDRLVFVFGNSEAAAPFRYELRLVSCDGTEHRILAAYPPEVESLVALDWTAESGILFATAGPDSSSELLAMSPDEPAARVLERRKPGSGLISGGTFTRDGRAVVYLANGSLYHVARGKSARKLGVDADALLGFTADGGRILFHGTRERDIGIWSIQFRNGRTIGTQRLERPTKPGVIAGGRTTESVAYVEPATLPKLFRVTLDLERGAVLRGPRVLNLPIDSIPGNPAFSRDGARLAFTLRTPNRMEHRVMVSQGVDGSRKEIGRVDLRVMGLDWSANGKAIVLGGRGDIRPSSWVGRIDASSGAIERLAHVPANAVAAGRTEEIAYVRAAPAGERSVRVMHLARPNERPRTLATYTAAELPRSMSVSPDGKWVAVVKSVDHRKATALILLPTEGGESKTALKLERPDALELNLGSIPWTSDSRKVVVLMRRQGKRHLALVDIVTGAITAVPFAPQEQLRHQPALHPNGREMVYVDGEARSKLKLINAGSK